MSLQQIVFPTNQGPVVFRPRQVVKCEGVYFMIESVNVVRNGNQVRMYQMHESEALKYYIPSRPAAAAPAVAAPAAPAFTPPPPAPTAAPGIVPGAAAVEAPTSPTGAVPPAVADGMLGNDVERKPITGLTQEEIQEGLALGYYTQDEEGNVFAVPGKANPNDPQAGAAPNHKINPKAADGQ